MIRTKWNRRIKIYGDQLKNDEESSKPQLGSDYKPKRVRPRRKKKRHPGYTIIPEHRFWIFENNK